MASKHLPLFLLVCSVPKHFIRTLLTQSGIQRPEALASFGNLPEMQNQGKCPRPTELESSF